VIFILRKTEVRPLEFAAPGLPPGDGAAPVELPVDKREGDDVGDLNLHGRDQQRLSIGLLGRDQLNDQVNQGILVRRDKDEGLTDR